MAERAKDQRAKEMGLLDNLIKKHEELIPTVMKTQVMVDLYWKCYAYGDELKPHIEFLDGIMLSSTRDIAPSCVENVDELIERQEKSLVQLDSKKNVVVDLIAKGKVILEHPDKPKFLEGNVKRISDGWDETKTKAQERLKLLQDTKEAWVGYGENNETIAAQFEVAEAEIKMVKKRYNLEDALSDMKKRQDLYNKSNNTIAGLFKSINDNFTCMSITLPEDKKKIVDKEIKAVEAKLEVAGRFKDTVKVIEDFCAALVNFDNSLKAVDGWKDAATAELKDIKEASGAMLPEDRVARTMDLQEDIAAKLEILKGCAATEAALLPQGIFYFTILFHYSLFAQETVLTRTPRPSRMSWLGSLTTSPSWLLTPRLSATSTPTMSSSGLSTGLESRNTLPGWLGLRRPQLRVWPSHLISMRSRL